MLDFILLICLLVISGAIILTKDVLACSLLFSAYSFIMVILWQSLGAPDVALVEAVIGVGVTTIFFILAIGRSSRREDK